MGNVFRGKSVCGGIAIGKIRVLAHEQRQVVPRRINDPEAELQRLSEAKHTAVLQLKELYEKALQEVGEENAAIFDIHQILLEDGSYNETIADIIRTQSANAEYAVAVTADIFAERFSGMEDEAMRARAADVRDISERLISVLSGRQEGLERSGEPVIIVAEDLAPSETVQLDREKVLAFVTVHGSENSHTAILARTMGIPALIGTKLGPLDALDGKNAVVDGGEGCLYVDPGQDVLEHMQAKRRTEQEKKEMLQTLKGKESVTLDGRKVMLYANIGDTKDLELALKNDAEGIGLFRSEFLFLERDHLPGEEEQFQVYRSVLEAMDGKPVIIRTLDIGADKKCPYLHLEKEENPALGFRGIRVCLARTELFKTQLRALFRAGAYGNLGVMYPMIISVEEVQRILEIAEEVKAELKRENLPVGNPLQGIMIETPAAVMVSDELAEYVDFFSIGTNDLTQYTLAIDRQNPNLEAFYDPCHPAVLRMIDMVVKNAHRHHIWAGICGELGGDTDRTEEFLKMGVDELSVSPSWILPLRKKIRETELNAEKQCAE